MGRFGVVVAEVERVLWLRLGVTGGAPDPPLGRREGVEGGIDGLVSFVEVVVGGFEEFEEGIGIGLSKP